jgi:hypothetical protein
MKHNIELMIIEQTPDHLFNRGKLLNIGVKESPDADAYIFHDVDTLPNERIISTRYVARHFDIMRLRLPHSSSFGNVCKLSNHAVHCMNGHPNNIWGWGVEDRALFFRYVKMSAQITLEPWFSCNGWRVLPHSGIHRKYTPETKRMSAYYWDRRNISSSKYLADGLSTVAFDKISDSIRVHLFISNGIVRVGTYRHLMVKV